jgi:hypothetical protein
MKHGWVEIEYCIRHALFNSQLRHSKKRSMHLRTRITLIIGLGFIVVGCAGRGFALLDKHRTQIQAASAIANMQEGRLIVVSGKVERLLDESKGRIGVAIAPHAQLYFIARSDQNFEKWLTLLKEARDSKSRVKCTVRAYSGRIEHVELQK